MPFAITIRCDNDSSRPLRALWQRAGELETTPSMASLNYPPHITLAVYDAIDPAELRTAAENVFRDQPPISLRFKRLHYFEGDPLVLWADPSPSPALSRLHASVHQAISPSLCREHYRPKAWKPHSSLALQVLIHRRMEALDFCREIMEPFVVTFDVGDAVSFLPVEVIAECRLRAHAGDS